ncbi:MAG: HesA/MoeB/ThiF family protein [Prevotella sp.]|jgi:adenylyltransferase/sulfurtransferase|nr:HesA/MoeB/ThiF family protein [Prevotella sp.]
MEGQEKGVQAWGEDIYPELSWFEIDKVRQAKVMVVGCGALGNEVLKNLALFGVEHIVAVDFDRVEPGNLTRSILFSQTDALAGRSKVEAVAERLRQINPAVVVAPIEGDIAYEVGLGLIGGMNVIIGCVDNRLARYHLNRLCMRAGVPWIDGGMEGLEGTVRVFVPGKNCYACNLGTEGLKELSRRTSCAELIRRYEENGKAATTPVVASVIGAVQVQEAMKLLHRDKLDRGELTSLCGKMFYYEGQHLSSRIVGFTGYDDDCPVHEPWTPIVKSDLRAEMTIRETLDSLAELLEAERVDICLRDYSFVDYVAERANDRKTDVMLPDYKVSRFVEDHPVLRFMPYGELYQHEYSTLGADFPYQTLTLRETGIPEWDVLHVRTEKGVRYVETLKTVII